MPTVGSTKDVLPLGGSDQQLVVKNSAANGDVGVLSVPLVTRRILRPNAWYDNRFTADAANTTYPPATGASYYMPVYLVPCTITALSMSFAAITGSISASMGLLASSTTTLKPTTLLGSATISGFSTTGAYTFTLPTPVTVTAPAWYHIGLYTAGWTTAPSLYAMQATSTVYPYPTSTGGPAAGSAYNPFGWIDGATGAGVVANPTVTPIGFASIFPWWVGYFVSAF